ncbi:hypothetical protein HJG60_011162 [Phyllostomus discolor]|uniref:Uncharacterized protein n=1 Tax=Phyllostomus discolor TaxID=89673 RepID=A0A834A1X9_9CHIR|nr:hypothetical protein HJG60_011162 [Phyllostomus discolor]
MYPELISSHSPPPSPITLVTTNLLSVSVDLPVDVAQKWKPKVFCVWLVSPSVFSRFTHDIVACVGPSFVLLLSNILWCGYATFCLFLWCWTFGLFSFLGCYEQCCCAHSCTGFCVNMFYILLCMCLGKALLGHRVTLSLIFKEVPYHFPK